MVEARRVHGHLQYLTFSIFLEAKIQLFRSLFGLCPAIQWTHAPLDNEIIDLRVLYTIHFRQWGGVGWGLQHDMKLLILYYRMNCTGYNTYEQIIRCIANDDHARREGDSENFHKHTGAVTNQQLMIASVLFFPFLLICLIGDNGNRHKAGYRSSHTESTEISMIKAPSWSLQN